MPEQAQCVIIGGGIAGCSTLYHLTQEGMTDVILLERDELTSGTTWHSAAQVTNFGMTQTMVGLKSHSIALYQDLANDPEYPINYHHGDGGIRLANTQAQMDGYRHFASMARGMGVEFEVIDAAECARRHPLISTDDLVGGLWDPSDGDIDPAQLCQALARRARKAGAKVIRHRAVTGLRQLSDHSWVVGTDQGDIHAQIVVNAAGYRVNEVASMMGVTHPVMSMEHQYFVTEEMPQIKEAGHRMPLIRCPISDFYSRQEKNGLLVGFYEQDCKTWGMDGIDPGFTNDLCPNDLDRVMDVLEGAFARLPALQDVGIHTIVNGPITYSFDGAPLVGPVPGLRNAFCIIGLRAGLGEGGGHGWLLAQQIVHGEACYDTWGLDPRRFTSDATVDLTALKAIEDYQNEFRFHFPHEHRPAGRPMKTTALTDMFTAQNAEFTLVNRWERVDYIKPSAEFKETHSFRFNEAFDVVARDVKAVQTSLGITEVNGFTRYEITGADKWAIIDRMICGGLPKGPGRVRLAYLLNHFGMLKSEATLAHLTDGRLWYGSAAASEWHDRDWLMQHIRADEDVQIANLTNSHTILLMAGPNTPKLLTALCPGLTLPWLHTATVQIDQTQVEVMAVSFSGEQAYELHVPNTQLKDVYNHIMEHAAPFDPQIIGARAVESMRLEKGYLHWKAELLTEFDPFETGLDRFVSLEKPDFIGKDALLKRRQNGPTRQLVTLKIDTDMAPAHAGSSLMAGNTVIGTVTSGDWGHRVGMNLALAFIDPKHSTIGTRFDIDIIGHKIPAEVIAPSPYDPDMKLLRPAR